ncbi:hypothetical protein K5D56_21785 [Pseudomonas cichorii]|nr:hypothetical protein [Pseudomonas cichorii]MBX8557101.1 hypothetical protein [Pseudomonas cichorii]MBX8592001.1 hypothetical protein [Pseudomonas cichorii]
MNDNLIFKSLSNPLHKISVHNVTLVDAQPSGDGKGAVLTVEYQGNQQVLRGDNWFGDSSCRDIGQVGYVVPAPNKPDEEPGAVFFRPYQDQSLRRVYELDSTNEAFQLVPLNFGIYPHHRAHCVCGWRCDSRPDGFLAPAGLVPGANGEFVHDETDVVSVRIPPEFSREALRHQMKTVELLESFIGDLAGIHNFANKPRADRYGSNGSDERMLASNWLDRAHGMNAIDLDAADDLEAERKIWEEQRSEWEDLLCQYADNGGDAELLLQAFDKLVDKLDESGPEVLLERLRGITDGL